MDFKKINFKAMVARSLADQVRDPPLFDWNDEDENGEKITLKFADEIIASVIAPTRNQSGIHRPSPRTNLTFCREGIAKLLAEVQEIYLVALDDHEARNDSKKLPRQLREKDLDIQPGLIPNGNACEASDLLEFCGDYRDGSDSMRDWETWYDETYALPRGNPGRNRSNGPPIAPLHAIYPLVRDWWRKHMHTRFHPTFDGDEVAYVNAPSRLLLGVIQKLDPDYTIENARGLYETMRKREPKPKKVI